MKHEVEIHVYVTEDNYIAQVEDDEHEEELSRASVEVETFSVEVPECTVSAIVAAGKVGEPHAAYAKDTDAVLFARISNTANMYAQDLRGEWDFPAYDSKTKPKAVEYRIKVLQQMLTELQARVQQQEQ